MQKTVLFPISIIFLSCNLLSCNLFSEKEKTNPNIESEVKETLNSQESQDNLSYDERVALTRARVALRSIIRKGDYYKARNDAQTAIKYYSNVALRIENDPSISLRLANAYFELKNFQKAHEFYQKIPFEMLDENGKNQLIGSIMFDSNRQNKKEEINKFPFLPSTKEYFSLVDDCIKTPEKCNETIASSSANEPRIQMLQSSLKDAAHISTDPLYILALLSGKFYEQRSFGASYALASYILASRPDYQEVMKMKGYSSYQLGKYVEAASWLEKYYSIHSNDAGTAYLLGIIHYLKEDYSTSNLYFNAAVLSGYTPKTELERRLVYNYTLLGDTVGAFKIFRYLLNEDDVTSEDFQIALFMALSENELSKAALWSQKSLLRFKDDPDLLVFSAQIARKEKNPDAALAILEDVLSKNPKHSFAHLEMGRLYLEKNMYTVAERSFEESSQADPYGFFGSEAKKELSLLAPLLSPNTVSGSVSPSPITQ